MSRRSVAILLALICCIPLAYLAFAAHDPRGGWDDGAITLAYAQTLSHVHRFSLTPISPVAEGSSSLLWTGLLALLIHWTRTATAILITAEVASAAALLLTLLTTYRLARHFLSPAWALLPAALFTLSKAAFSETRNGMEMNLYALLATTLALVLLRETISQRWLLLAWLLASGILLVRFESPLFLAALFAGVAWQRPRHRRHIATLAALAAVSFLAIELTRHHIFGAWVPNTVLAKRWYAFHGVGRRARLLYRLDALRELGMVVAVPVAAVLVAAFAARPTRPTLRRALQNKEALLVVSFAAVLQCLIIGRNWGQEGRMLVAFLPFLLIVLCVPLTEFLRDNRIPIVAVAVCAVAAQGALLTQAPKTELYGFAYRWCELAGMRADTLRAALHLRQARFLTPDVGGAGLCCAQLDVLDLGLLTNPTLARTGYSGLPALFRAESPDIIEAKAPWSVLSGLYEKHLLEGYSPVEVRGALLFARNDLLTSDVAVKESPCSSLPQPEWWSAVEPDIAYARQQPHCFVLREPGD